MSEGVERGYATVYLRDGTSASVAATDGDSLALTSDTGASHPIPFDPIFNHHFSGEIPLKDYTSVTVALNRAAEVSAPSSTVALPGRFDVESPVDGATLSYADGEMALVWDGPHDGSTMIVIWQPCGSAAITTEGGPVELEDTGQGTVPFDALFGGPPPSQAANASASSSGARSSGRWIRHSTRAASSGPNTRSFGSGPTRPEHPSAADARERRVDIFTAGEGETYASFGLKPRRAGIVAIVQMVPAPFASPTSAVRGYGAQTRSSRSSQGPRRAPASMKRSRSSIPRACSSPSETSRGRPDLRALGGCLAGPHRHGAVASEPRTSYCAPLAAQRG